MDDLAAIARLIEAIRPWLGDLVLVGGWAHRLHRFHPRAGSPTHLPVQTRDADLAFSQEARLAGDIAAALRKANFREELSSDHQPPIAQYRLGEDDQGFYAEFLTPLRGGESRRDGAPSATVRRAGVTAQKLRHLDMLLIQPWAVRLDADVGVPLVTPADVRLTNPVSFIPQKMLIRKQREPDKQAQDVLYIHDTLELFGGDLGLLKTAWRGNVRPAIGTAVADRVERLSREQFGTVTDVIREASRIAQDRTLAPDRMRAVCSYGLEEIFGAG